MSPAIALAERGLVPEPLERWGIRRLLRRRLARSGGESRGEPDAEIRSFAEAMRRSPVALSPEAANEQHYEVPPEFYALVLGPHRKYSSCWFPPGVETLADAEAAMLALTAERAQLVDGQRILELGCGWGSLTLWNAERFPNSWITAVSNSRSQRAWIEAEARRRGLGNVEVITRDMNDFMSDRRYDRVVSVEMFEHMRNWERLLSRVRGWLEPDGRLFLHVFSHRRIAYPFEAGTGDWMARHFFTGGMMPAHGLLRFLDIPFAIDGEWEVEGTHYRRTAEAWLENLEARRAEILPILAATYGGAEASRWYHRWRLFFLACAELFGYERGRQWQVSHYRLRPL